MARGYSATHEDLSRKEEIKPSSNRVFGLVFAALALVLGLAPLLRGRPIRWPGVAAAAVLLAISVAAPALLEPINRQWTKVATVLQTISNTIIMGLLFCLSLTPIAFIMRLAKRDPLQLRWDAEAQSYWIKRPADNSTSSSMTDQF